MRIILSPAKKMRTDTDSLDYRALPVFVKEAEIIAERLKGMGFEELKVLWKCNDKIVKQNMERLDAMALGSFLTPALLSYEGIAYQYIAASVLGENELEYLQNNLRILSGFYGVLKPMDGVREYRLEMQAELEISGCKNLYSFWGDRLYNEVIDEDRLIVNLASKEYSVCISEYLRPEDRMINIVFAEESKGRLVQKATYAKMARGEMVRYMAEMNIQSVDELKGFDRMGYVFREDISTGDEYVFERKPVK